LCEFLLFPLTEEGEEVEEGEEGEEGGERWGERSVGEECKYGRWTYD